eukprot:CAMPEP_0170917962 /NCGR_PEP_ID=MMETSP0735-20130129/7695_1 /TAXON_ID=186038 /ORGANISM="Fragilariopsis kerguelensis, Strain L26-C5" /LENGTH=246 /DNA_ID=CAMNT_0011316341 /DNA_START=81 /DNA_END=821 /DNA_ORIENTATION=-
MKSGARILFVWGSESNMTKGFTQTITEQWKEKHFGKEIKVLDVYQGDDLSEVWEEKVTTDNYDFVLVATSSFAEGDPPSGFGRFLYKLQEAARKEKQDQLLKSNTEPPFLKGMQHAVLGVGNTQYDTFQNIPRHVDMYLGECGSRRCKQRLEWDEMDNSESDILQWASEMLAIILKDNKADDDDDTVEASKPNVCSWKEPASELYEKIVNEDGWEGPNTRTQTEISPLMMVLGLVVIVAACWYNKS